MKVVLGMGIEHGNWSYTPIKTRLSAVHEDRLQRAGDTGDEFKSFETFDLMDCMAFMFSEVPFEVC